VEQHGSGKMKSVDEFVSEGFHCLIDGKYEESEEACRMAIATDPNHCGAWLVLSVTLFLCRQFTEAIEARLKADKLYDQLIQEQDKTP